jgi:hypothetical protein
MFLSFVVNGVGRNASPWLHWELIVSKIFRGMLQRAL